MGMQDRDYYREWWEKKEQHVEKSKFRVALGKPSRQISKARSNLSKIVIFLVSSFVFGLAFKVVQIVAGHYLH